ncbi:MAG: HAD-IC family P-type ATPase [Xanthomonadaceae bacterium]|nr:HAD-IC family P-type ATPase [Xanthomonadaceae bacterium]
MTLSAQESLREPLADSGLTSAQARERLARFGANVVADPVIHAWRRAIEKFWTPVPWMLEIAMALELALGKSLEAAIIALLLVFNAALGLFQEGRAQATLAALKSRLALNASVRRDGNWHIVPAAQLVPGDVVKLSLGAVVPADVRLVEGEVRLDQSLLTGESVPVDAGAGSLGYAGALVRRGEAVAQVTATGEHTRFGRTAELVRTAHVVSSQQNAVLHVVRNLALVNGAVIVLLVGYGLWLKWPLAAIVSLGLTALLSAIPVALPATFTLAAAFGARFLVGQGVLPTRLSAIDEAASLDVLCVDKTGTLTQNALRVTAVHALGDFGEAQVLELAALASAEGRLDPVDAAIHAAAAASGKHGLQRRQAFVPFDPATRIAQAEVIDADGSQRRVVKGALATVLRLVPPVARATTDAAEALLAQGYRVLGVAAGSAENLTLAGFVALSDPPRADSAQLIVELHALGVRTVMVTGDAATTAAVIARQIGLDGPIYPPGPMPAQVHASQYAVFAGVLPEDKFNLVKGFQARGHVVGMCGDGANDAPALRQAQMGIAVSTATDVAKSAAGMVLTQPGLAGIVAAVRTGRRAFQRVLSYTLNVITKKTVQALFLAVGLLLTGQAILTPFLMVLIMVTGDLLGMALTVDNVQSTARPNRWQIDRITLAGVLVGLGELVYCSGMLLIAMREWKLDADAVPTLAFLLVVFGNQATCYINRDRRHWWSSRPSIWLIASSAADVAIASTLAIAGLGMTAVPGAIVAVSLGGAFVFLLVLDLLKAPLFARLQLSDSQRSDARSV